MPSQLPSSTMEYNPFHGHVDAKIVDAIEAIGFKRDKRFGYADHWHRWVWHRPFSRELIILGLTTDVWLYDNGQGTRFWSACHDDLFDCITKGRL